MHDLAAFVLHLRLLLGVAVGQENIHLRQDVEGDLVGIDLARDGLAGDDLPDLAAQFLDGPGAGAGDGLVAGGKNRLDCQSPVQRVERHERDGGGAIGIGDDAVVPRDVAALISGTTSGTASSMRKALELSTTTQPALTARGAIPWRCRRRR